MQVESILQDDIIELIIRKGEPQHVANTAWACAKLGVECPALFKAINDNASYLVEQGSPQAVANTARACAKLGVECPALFKAINDNASYLVEEGNPQDVEITAWACAKLDCRLTSFFGALSSRMDSVAASSNVQGIVDLCYSFAILDLALEYETEFRVLWNRAVQFKDDNLAEAHLRQLVQTFDMVSRVMDDLPPPNELLQSVGSLKRADIDSSRAQQEMSELLNEVGFAHEIEVSPFPNDPVLLVPGLWAIDAACKDRMIAIEFDGPTHYLRERTDPSQTSILATSWVDRD
jgi:hypothetical protein